MKDTSDALNKLIESVKRDAAEYMDNNKATIFSSVLRKEPLQGAVDDVVGAFRFEIETLEATRDKLSHLK